MFGIVGVCPMALVSAVGIAIAQFMSIHTVLSPNATAGGNPHQQNSHLGLCSAAASNTTTVIMRPAVVVVDQQRLQEMQQLCQSCPMTSLSVLHVVTYCCNPASHQQSTRVTIQIRSGVSGIALINN